MKIINDTENRVYYVVTPSGTTLSGSKVIASGTIDANDNLDFPLDNAGKNPIVYVKGINSGAEGFLMARPASGKGIVTLTLTPEDN